MIEQADFAGGSVVFWDFHIAPHRPLSEQINELKEDLIQVAYRGDILIDVGWYPEFSADGNFIVQLIRNEDWASPLMKFDAPSVESLRACVERCVEKAKQLAVPTISASLSGGAQNRCLDL